MQVLGFHIISDAELRRQKEEARDNQRNMSNTLVTGLLYCAEYYRKQANSNMRMVPRRPRTISESRERKNK